MRVTAADNSVRISQLLAELLHNTLATAKTDSFIAINELRLVDDLRDRFADDAPRILAPQSKKRSIFL